MEEIILKECTGQELSRAERLQLKAWLAESPKNRKVYAQMKLAVLSPESSRRGELKEEVWHKLKNDIRSSGKNTTADHHTISYWIRIAAVFIVCLSVGYIVYQLSDQRDTAATIREAKMVEKVSLPGQRITTALSDGTIVKLNSDSRIIVPSGFSGDAREVTLYGEAFFNVARDESKPFIIKTSDIQVKVLGTSFNVKAYPGDRRSVVAVATGKVSVSDGHEREYLIPGERIVYKSTAGLLGKEKYEWEKEFGWKENILSFDGETLPEITRILSRWYGVEFMLNNNNNLDLNKQFSGRYKDASLEAVLIGLSYVYDFKYDIHNKKVTIK